MKNYRKLICLFIYFLFNGRLLFCQRVWKAQSNPTTCWAAATENVFYSMSLPTKECDLLKSVRGGVINSCIHPVGLFDIGRDDYILVMKNYASFSYLESTQKTLSWNYIRNTINPALTKPFIVSFDHGEGANHFVNVFKTVEAANKQWLFVFDPFLTGKGVKYLKNYQTYQLAGNPNNGIQCTYWNFGKVKDATNRVFVGSRVAGSNPLSASVIYSDTSKVKASINLILSPASRSILPDSITGIITGVTLVTTDMASMSPLLNIRRDSSLVLLSTIVQDETNTFVIPVFKDNGSRRLEFVSMILILRNKNKVDQYVLDRVQKLVTSATLSESDYTRGRDGSIKLSKKLMENLQFNITEDGNIYLKLDKSYYNLSYENSNPIDESQFYGKIEDRDKELISNPNNNEPASYKGITPLERSVIRSDRETFSRTLSAKGLIVQGDQLKINNSVIKIKDFQNKLKTLKNVQNIVILQKSN
jgi:hypothetical protein